MQSRLQEDAFHRLVTNSFPDSANIDFTLRSKRHMFYASVANIDRDDVSDARTKFDSSPRDVGYAVTETSEGLGMEVWEK